MLETNNRVLINDLTRIFKTSAVTIRKDPAHLTVADIENAVYRDSSLTVESDMAVLETDGHMFAFAGLCSSRKNLTAFVGPALPVRIKDKKFSRIYCFVAGNWRF